METTNNRVVIDARVITKCRHTSVPSSTYSVSYSMQIVCTRFFENFEKTELTELFPQNCYPEEQIKTYYYMRRSSISLVYQKFPLLLVHFITQGYHQQSVFMEDNFRLRLPRHIVCTIKEWYSSIYMYVKHLVITRICVDAAVEGANQIFFRESCYHSCNVFLVLFSISLLMLMLEVVEKLEVSSLMTVEEGSSNFVAIPTFVFLRVVRATNDLVAQSLLSTYDLHYNRADCVRMSDIQIGYRRGVQFVIEELGKNCSGKPQPKTNPY
uniref:Uncharacterized protein n=1 Tax=Glossina pallidipes TaxID=7398 RepID=A0A1A9ZJZ0_GLOPL